jgi:hypothetical protein
MSAGITISTPEGIAAYRLIVMKSAVKLESKGMKMSRGRNITAQARRELGLKARAPHAEVIAALEAKIKEITG